MNFILIIILIKFKDHNCVRELRNLVKGHEQKLLDQEKLISDIQYQLAEQRREISLLRDHRSNNLPNISSINVNSSSITRAPLSNSGASADMGSSLRNPTDGLLMLSQANGTRTLASRMQEADAVRSWCNSLPRAKVTRWGGMISTPDTDLQAQIRRSLADSGIPSTNLNGQSQMLDDLMANAHERRWPPGLLTLETRQMNRRQYEQYVCRRVPGRQAVVVMACDNAHMSDDMICEPGLVMIFAHGIE